MKILINGNMIDTEKIYVISKIWSETGKFYYNHEDFLEKYSFGFCIKFINHKDVSVRIRMEYLKWVEADSLADAIEITKGKSDELYAKIKKFRDEIINHWEPNQTSIPQIDFSGCVIIN